MAKSRMTRSQRRPVPEAARYNQKTLHRDRQYGFYWYSALWRVLRPLLVFACALIIVAGIVLTGVNRVNEAFFMAVNPGNEETVDFVIDQGSSISTIGSNLEDQGLIRNKGIFKYIIQFKGLTSKIQYGSYPLNRNMDVNQIIDVLCAGSATNERTITIIPGWTVEDIAGYLMKQGAIKDTQEFLTLCNDLDRFVDQSYSLQNARKEDGVKDRRYQLEGYLAPDTYRIYMNADAESIIGTLLKQNEAVMDEVFNTAPAQQIVRDETGEVIAEDPEDEDPETEDPGDGEQEEVQFVTTLNQDETLVLASIIEKEAAKRSDYAKVSAVFHNRLEKGIRLESDATAAYPLGVNRMVLTADELETVNGYNTYTKDGLPVGPLCNPSKEAIRAALYPDTEYIYDGYLYFCAGDPETGELLFSKDREEHQKNVSKYRQMWIDYDQNHGNGE